MKKIGDHYKVCSLIGRGGMGEVYRATDPEGREVAVKTLPPALVNDPDARRRLKEEVKSLQKATGTGIADIIDWELEGAEPFLVTEFISGPTLEAEVRERGVWKRQDLADLGYKLAETIEQLHAKGIVHRDIKPSNIVVSSEGPKLIDFGIAHIIGSERLTQSGAMGTVGYTSPEILKGGHPGESNDWWAWASVLVYCATGRPPFGKLDGHIIEKVCTGTPDLAGVDEDIAACLRAGLRAEPSLRVAPRTLVQWLAHGMPHDAEATPEVGEPTVVVANAPAVGADVTRVLAQPVPSARPPVAVVRPQPAAGEADAWDPEAARHVWHRPYHPPTPARTWLLSIALWLFTGAFVLSGKFAGPVLVVAAFVGFVCIEGVSHRLHRRRADTGYCRDGDVGHAFLALPKSLAWGVVIGAITAAITGCLAFVAWQAIQYVVRGPDSPWTLRQALLFSGELTPLERTLLWLLALLVLVVAWWVPLARPVRGGYQAAVTWLLGSWWVRGIVVVVLVVAAGVLLLREGVIGEIDGWVGQLSQTQVG